MRFSLFTRAVNTDYRIIMPKYHNQPFSQCYIPILTPFSTKDKYFVPCRRSAMLYSLLCEIYYSLPRLPGVPDEA
ncbi:hypothetical protein UA45_06905 [Morganella morganii]|uniref:Uncharacterized protein n=1 Tax=Morganella morganii TaxID=582 RepID=A0A0D8L8P9_MORMO|nr:hypothetical protein UA45_06905 [Morganella morganii]